MKNDDTPDKGAGDKETGEDRFMRIMRGVVAVPKDEILRPKKKGHKKHRPKHKPR